MKNILRVIEICKERGISQEDLAAQLGISRVALSKCLNGNPTIESLSKIAEILGVEIRTLFKGCTNDFIAMVKIGDNYITTTDKEELTQFLESNK